MATTTEKSGQPSIVQKNDMTPTLFTVDQIRKETADTFTIELLPQNEADQFSYLPGQFNMLYIFGVGEVPISISGDPKKSPRLVHTIRNVGTVTAAMSSLSKGDTIGVRGPFGSAWPVEKAKGQDVVLVCGGIGLAPLRPALYHILNNRDDYGKVIILYGTRTPDDFLFRKEVESWRARFDLYVDATVDASRGDWHGNVGVVTSLIPKVSFDSLDTIAMICGPEVMMRFTAMSLLKKGVPVEKIYVSMERSMKCGIGLCGHCQMGHYFICKDGPVFPYNTVRQMMLTREL